MCGIAVAINWDGAPAAVARLIDGILHRGDVSDPVISPTERVAMGTRRLRIVDPAGGRQPKTSFDGQLLVSFNGEIYNHHEIRRELEALGVAFCSDNDTEVLANALAAWGGDALQRLNGMYAFVAYDLKSGEFLAARDPFGVKPLYVVQSGESFLFCSEMRPLLAEVPFGQVMLLPPGHLLTKRVCRKFYSLPAGDSSAPQSVELMDELLDHAVASRLPKDLDAPVLFSGGIDSTLVLHYARRHRRNTPAYFVGNDDAPDLKFAQAYADLTGTDFHRVTFDPCGKDTLALLETIVEVAETFEPSAIQAGLYTYLLSERIHRDGYRVALSGEGADELFAGYAPIEHGFTYSAEVGRNLQEQALEQMHRSNLQRLDRCGMRWAVEIREPLLDRAIAGYSRNLSASALIKMIDGLPQGKQPLREVYDRHPGQLPQAIRNRHKLVFSEGAGIGSERDSWRALFEDAVSDKEFADARRGLEEYGLATKEEYFYFRAFSRKFDPGRIPHLKNRLRLLAPADLAPMPAEMARLRRDAPQEI